MRWTRARLNGSADYVILNDGFGTLRPPVITPFLPQPLTHPTSSTIHPYSPLLIPQFLYFYAPSMATVRMSLTARYDATDAS